MSKSFADVMASEKNGRKRATVQVCFSPDLEREYAGLEVDLEEAYAEEQRAKDPETGSTKGRRLGQKVELRSREIAQQMTDLVESNADAFYDIEVSQIRRHDWLQIRTEHPPRDGHPEDGGMYNRLSFGPAAVRACMVDPEPSDEAWAYLEDNLSTGEWERLTMQVWALNEGGRSVPKSVLASRILSGSGSE